VNVINIGRSWEGRDMKVVSICRREAGCGNPEVPKIWIDGGRVTNFISYKFVLVNRSGFPCNARKSTSIYYEN